MNWRELVCWPWAVRQTVRANIGGSHWKTRGAVFLQYAPIITCRRSCSIGTNIKINSLQHSPSWEANRSSVSQEIPPVFYGTRRFITAFTSTNRLSLSWARSIQLMSPHPTSWRSTLTLSSHLHLGLPSGLFPSGLPTKTLYVRLLSVIHSTCRAHLIVFDLIIRIELHV